MSVLRPQPSEDTPLLSDSTLTIVRRYSDSQSSSNSSMALSKYFGNISGSVYTFVILFAIASWIDINGLWVQLPLMVHRLPEGWTLPSYLTIIIQVANVGALVYTLAKRICPTKVQEWPVVYIIIAIGATACILLVFFWDRTTFVLGAQRSTALISLASFLALVDCTSSVVFLPYMATFKPEYMTAFYIGEGMSGLIPGVIGLIQGVGREPDCVNKSIVVVNETTGLNSTEWRIEAIYSAPLFSVEVFFVILFCMLIVSAVAFTFLHFLPSSRQEMVKNSVYWVDQSDASFTTYEKQCELESDKKDLPKVAVCLQSPPKDGYKTQLTPKEEESDSEEITNPQFIFLLGCTAFLNALSNGVIPSTQSYSCLPYGNVAYTLAVRLASIANPLASFMAVFLPSKSIVLVAVLSAMGGILAGFQLFLAAMSPNPPLVGTFAGSFIVVTTSVAMTGFMSFAKVTIASILRYKGHSALLWCGGLQQVGSFCGATITFILVNVLRVFTSKQPCT